MTNFRSVVLKRGRWVEVVWDGGQILLPLNIQQYLGTFLVVTIGDAVGIECVETRETAKHPSVHTTHPHNKESSSPKCHWSWGWEGPALVYWIIKPSDSFFVVVLSAFICKSQIIIICLYNLTRLTTKLSNKSKMPWNLMDFQKEEYYPHY